MLYGKFDHVNLLANLTAILIAGVCAVITGYGFLKDLGRKSGSQSWLDLIYYIVDNTIDILSGSGGVFLAFLFTAFATLFSLITSLRCNMRERHLHQAFGVGLWHGYQRNFLDRVVNSITRERSTPPIILIASPSFHLFDASFDYQRFLSEDVPVALHEKGYSMQSIYGEGKAPWFRQVFKIARVNEEANATSKIIFFDLPTTFVAFEGAANKVQEMRREYLDSKKKEEFFDGLKEEFFNAMRVWSRLRGIQAKEVPVENTNSAEFARRIIDALG